MYNGKRVGVCISSFVYDQTSFQQLKFTVLSFATNSSVVDEIYVTDDSSPHTPVWAFYNEVRIRGVKVIRNHKNRGIGAMKNLGLRLLSNCDILFLVDGDTSVKKGWDTFYCNGLEETKHESVHLCNIFGDNEPYKQEQIGSYTLNYHSKYQGAFMCVTKEALKGVGGFPLLPQRYGCEHYNWQVRLSRSLGLPQCVFDFEGGKRYVTNDHRSNSFITAHEKNKQSAANGTTSDAILSSKVNYMDIKVENDGELGNDVSIIIPFRQASWNWQAAENGDRLSNLLFTMDYYKSILPNADLTVVEQDRQPVVKSKIRGDANYLFLKNNSTFNKCWSYNYAAGQTKRPLLVFLDSDALIRPEVFHEAIREIRANYAVYKPYNRFLDLSAQLASHFKNTLKFSWKDGNLGQRCVANEWFTGGCVMAKRDAFFQIGGFNEKFRGWGGEDDEFIARARALVPTGKAAGPRNLYHLYHLVTKDAQPNHPMYLANLAELEKVGSMNNGQLIEYAKELAKDMGNPEKYANE